MMRYQRELYYLRLHLLQIQYSSEWYNVEQRVACHEGLIDALLRRDEKAFINVVVTRCQEMYGLDSKIVELYKK